MHREPSRYVRLRVRNSRKQWHKHRSKQKANLMSNVLFYRERHQLPRTTSAAETYGNGAR